MSDNPLKDFENRKCTNCNLSGHDAEDCEYPFPQGHANQVQRMRDTASLMNQVVGAESTQQFPGANQTDLQAQIESLQQQLADSNSENELLRTRLGSILWSGSLDDKTCGTVQKWVEEHKSELEQQLAEAKETVSKHEQLMIRVNERVQTIRFSEDRVYIYQPSNEEFDDLRKEIFILQQARDKLQYVVGEMRKALKAVSYDCGSPHQWATMVDEAVELSPDNLPRFVPEGSVYYNKEHDNFYCACCKKGMGQTFYKKHKHEKDDPMFSTTPESVERKERE